MKYEEVPKISNFTGAKSHNINVYSSIKKIIKNISFGQLVIIFQRNVNWS